MQANSYSPFALKDLHQAIDLLDRKIASCTAWETFETEQARELHVRKLATKRAALVKSALTLAEMGVRCDPRFLPRSFIPPARQEASSAVAQSADGAATGALARPRSKRR